MIIYFIIVSSTCLSAKKELQVARLAALFLRKAADEKVSAAKLG